MCACTCTYILFTLITPSLFAGERLFPPQSGMTFSSWICVDKFSMAVTDPHPVRLLTIVRNIAGRDDNLICLSVHLAPRDRALFVSTQERHMPAAGMVKSSLHADFVISWVSCETQGLCETMMLLCGLLGGNVIVWPIPCLALCLWHAEQEQCSQILQPSLTHKKSHSRQSDMLGCQYGCTH